MSQDYYQNQLFDPDNPSRTWRSDYPPYERQKERPLNPYTSPRTYPSQPPYEKDKVDTKVQKDIHSDISAIKSAIKELQESISSQEEVLREIQDMLIDRE